LGRYDHTEMLCSGFHDRISPTLRRVPVIGDCAPPPRRDQPTHSPLQFGSEDSGQKLTLNLPVGPVDGGSVSCRLRLALVPKRSHYRTVLSARNISDAHRPAAARTRPPAAGLIVRQARSQGSSPQTRRRQACGSGFALRGGTALVQPGSGLAAEPVRS
jgi:hypothetical protein